MLEKIILLSISYFCIGTELRFLSAPSSSPSEKGNSDTYEKTDSEKWQAQAI